MQNLSLPAVFVKKLDLSNLLLINAVRKPFGLTPLTSDLYLDKTENALWCWELVCPQLHLPPQLSLKCIDHRLVQQQKSNIFKILSKLSHAIISSKQPLEIS